MTDYRVTKTDAREALQALCDAYDKRLTKDEFERRVLLWWDVMDGVDPREFKKAIRQRIKEASRWFPRPGEIRELATRDRVYMQPSYPDEGDVWKPSKNEFRALLKSYGIEPPRMAALMCCEHCGEVIPNPVSGECGNGCYAEPPRMR